MKSLVVFIGKSTMTSCRWCGRECGKDSLQFLSKKEEAWMCGECADLLIDCYFLTGDLKYAQAMLTSKIDLDRKERVSQ